MTREDIIRMAEQCGLPEFENNESQADNLVRFFHMARAAEREALAQHFEQADQGGIHSAWVAAAIRARGQE